MQEKDEVGEGGVSMYIFRVGYIANKLYVINHILILVSGYNYCCMSSHPYVP